MVSRGQAALGWFHDAGLVFGCSPRGGPFGIPWVPSGSIGILVCEFPILFGSGVLLEVARFPRCPFGRLRFLARMRFRFRSRLGSWVLPCLRRVPCGYFVFLQLFF